MQPRSFLDAADDLASGPAEPHWRTAVGRAYYSLLLESRAAQSRWGLSALAQNQTHRVVRLRFVVAGDQDLLTVAKYLEELSSLRAKADYRPEDTTTFKSAQLAMKCIRHARAGVALLDQIDADAARRATVAAAMKKVYP